MSNEPNPPLSLENLADMIILRITAWLLMKSLRYATRKLDLEGQIIKKIQSLEPDPGDIQGMLSDYLDFKEDWQSKGMSNVEILIRSLNCWSEIFYAVVKLSIQSVFFQKEQKEPPSGNSNP